MTLSMYRMSSRRTFHLGTLVLLVTAASWFCTMPDARREAVTLAAGVLHPGGYGSDA